MMFIARLCTRSISLWRPSVSEVANAGHTYSRVGRTTVVYTVSRSSAGILARLRCNSRNNILPAFRVISSTCTSQVRLLVMEMPSIFATVTRWGSVPSMRMVEKFFLVLEKAIPISFVLRLLNLMSFWIVHRFAASAASWKFGAWESDPV